jgi:hypothetical protein
MEPLKVYCLVGLGSAVGGMGRLWVGNFVGRRFGETFPWGTLLVNVTGSILIGFVFALMGPHNRWAISPRLALFLMSGCAEDTRHSPLSACRPSICFDKGIGGMLEGMWACQSLCVLPECSWAIWPEDSLTGSRAGLKISRCSLCMNRGILEPVFGVKHDERADGLGMARRTRYGLMQAAARSKSKPVHRRIAGPVPGRPENELSIGAWICRRWK